MRLAPEPGQPPTRFLWHLSLLRMDIFALHMRVAFERQDTKVFSNVVSTLQWFPQLEE